MLTCVGLYVWHIMQRLYRKYFSTLSSASTQVMVPAPPRWESAESRKRKSGLCIGSEVITEEDRARKFVRRKKSAMPSAVAGTGGLPTSYGHATAPGSIVAAPVYKAPMYIPPDRQEQRATKRRKIRSWTEEVEPLMYGETLMTSSEEHQQVVESLRKLTGIDGFPGCEVSRLYVA